MTRDTAGQIRSRTGGVAGKAIDSGLTRTAYFRNAASIVFAVAGGATQDIYECRCFVAVWQPIGRMLA